MISRFILPHVLKYQFETILEIGPGHNSESVDFFFEHGKQITVIDIDDYLNTKSKYEFIKSDIVSYRPTRRFGAIMVSHIMEHIQDVGSFLLKLRAMLKDDGILFVIVPPFKHSVVGGHVIPGWNIGLLMYNLILTGFDVKNGRFKKDGYNIAAIVKLSNVPLPNNLIHDKGEIEQLLNYFPNGDFRHGFGGNIEEHNWFEE